MKKLYLLFVGLLVISNCLFAQVGINSDNSAPDSSAMLDVRSINKGMLIPRMTLEQRNAISSPAVGLMIYQTDNSPGYYYNSGTCVSPVWMILGAGSVHYIGEVYGGGIVFYVYDNGQHGLIAATEDQSTGTPWWNESNIFCNKIRNDGITIGRINTDSIIGKQGIGESYAYAAQICARYLGGGFGDWYLPSKFELNLLYQQKYVVGGFDFAIYWSSSEGSYNGAYAQSFSDGTQMNYIKSATNKVRAVRAF
jgi:hypothetical protein